MTRERWLVAVDGSARAPSVFAEAARLAAAVGAELVLFRAVGLAQDLPPEAYAMSPDDVAALVRARTTADLTKLAASAPPGVSVTTDVCSGQPWPSIEEAADRHGVSLIVVGSHGHRALDRVLGTTANRVVSHATRSVLVVPSGAMISIQAVGAAQTVTGSRHVVRTPRATILLDCGLFQGRRRESIERNRELGLDARAVDVTVLSHAHIDHSGALPFLVKNGFDGAVYATPATRDLCAVMLADAAMIQAADARYVNRAIERDGLAMDPVEPLYDQTDVTNVLRRMISVPYHRAVDIAAGVRLTFLDAGHVLGSAVCVLEIEDEGTTKRLVFTGDLGRRGMPILRDPEVPDGADLLLCESTYGDRVHPPIAAMEDALAAIVLRVHARGGRVVIPSFALERAQEVVYALHRLRAAGRLPRMPVYVDSPLTVKITDVFRLHPECFDEEAHAVVAGHDSPFDLPELRYVESVEDSKAIDAADEPSIVISASGMCEAGRIVHHLKSAVEDPRNAVVIVGFQAPHTLGRRIVERRARVKIFGVERDLRAEVAVLDGFSAHADQADLLRFAIGVRDGGRLGRVVLVHGEPPAQQALTEKLAAAGITDVCAPSRGEIVRF